VNLSVGTRLTEATESGSVDNGDIADFAMRLIVTCEHSGTTPPIELVDRAIEIAELTFDRLIEPGHAIVHPPFEELRESKFF
jgi:hypothetical protein